MKPITKKKPTTKKKPAKKKKSKKRKALVILSAFAFICLSLAYLWLVDNRMPAFKTAGVIQIYPDMTAEEVLEQVNSKLSPKHPGSLRRVFTVEEVATKMRPGSYSIDKDCTARYFARVLTHGWQSPVTLTLAGQMRTAESIAGKISAQMMTDSLSMLEALRDSVFLETLGTTPRKFFEIILPDTYQMYWDSPARDILKRLKTESDNFWTEERVALAKAQGLTPKQAVILASIISQESNKADEYPKIASVYLTRLHKGIPLQACPTICFINDYKIRRVLLRHLESDSPYNTYKFRGLPPGPIAVPDKEHINAVLNPDKTPYMYFCADSSFNGRNVFSVTYSEHLQKAKAYQSALDIREKEKLNESQGSPS